MHTAHCVVLTFRAKMEARVEKEEGGREGKETRKGARKRAGRAVYAFLSSRGFVCNNLCGETA